MLLDDFRAGHYSSNVLEYGAKLVPGRVLGEFEELYVGVWIVPGERCPTCCICLHSLFSRCGLWQVHCYQQRKLQRSIEFLVGGNLALMLQQVV